MYRKLRVPTKSWGFQAQVLTLAFPKQTKIPVTTQNSHGFEIRTKTFETIRKQRGLLKFQKRMKDHACREEGFIQDIMLIINR